MSKKLTIGVIGAGAIGLAIAADFSLAGYPVLMSEIDGFYNRLARTIKVSGLMFHSPHGVEGAEALVSITQNYSDFNQCAAVIVATTACAHATLLSQLVETLPPQTPIIVMCGNGSALAWAPGRKFLTETSTAPYGARVVPGQPQTLTIKILTPRFGVAGNPEGVQAALSVLNLIYREAYPLPPHPLAALLSNPNPLMHVGIMIANLTRIDHHDEFTFYGDGIGSSVNRLIERKDTERMALASKLGFKPVLFDDFEGVVLIQGQLVTQHFLECGNIARLAAPQSVQDRYFTEDVSYGLVAWEALGKYLGVETPLITAEITLVSTVLNLDLRRVMASRTEKILQALQI